MFQNKKKYVSIVFSLMAMVFICVGCGDDDAPMPYGSEEYENGEWTADELVDHFEELGFIDIDVEEFESVGAKEEFLNVQVEDTNSDSWFTTEYTDFKKGEPRNTYRKVRIEVYKPIPILTIENCPELVDVFSPAATSEEWRSFAQKYEGARIKFDLIVTDWYDEFWFASGINISMAVDGHKDIVFHWRGMSPKDVGLDTNKYVAGSVKEGTPAEIEFKIVESKDGYTTERVYIKIVNK